MFGGPLLPLVGWRTQTKHWPGWPGVKHVIFFGDSYTSVGWNPWSPQPSKSNPFGKEPFPAGAQQKRPNWADFLVTYYNTTFIDALDFAMGGATVDKDIVPQFIDSIQSMKMQVVDAYLDKYAYSPVVFPWRPADTLFVFWIGINDVNKVWLWDNGTEAMNQDLDQYAALVDKVYKSGARNFLFLNVPPVDRAPETLQLPEEYWLQKSGFIEKWNQRVEIIANHLTANHSEATVFQYNAHKAYTEVLNDPCSHPESCGIRDVSQSCYLYANDADQEKLSSWSQFYDECIYPIHEYFWVDSLHHTYRMHNVTARGVYELLDSIPNNFYD